ncbi:MAG TPA: TIGR00159 family protein [Clostridiales bacterium]|jgi:diadenylate cyclase|nr:TIGR00159 family protein [Clostridiales bacterium]
MDGLSAPFSSLWETFLDAISAITIKDIIDILIVAILFYYIIRFMSDRRAGKLAVGVVFLLIVQGLASLFGLVALKFIMERVFQMGVLAIIILFQPELRTMLENMGGDSLRGLKNIRRDFMADIKIIDSICQAISNLSLKKTGALVVIERSTKLGDVIRSGTVINADLEPYLLENIFFNKAPLHDGAVIIRDGRIYAAGCLLPLSTNTDIIKDLGTRHRAAIGMTENSDAVVLVVSEETGNISIALGGRLKRNYDYASLRTELEAILTETGAKKPAPVKSNKKSEKSKDK